ncbi:Monooxygenase FAD-binding protein [Macrophomina phaseolina MS6]|uniref:Monooxygenase FAD-binding protein n=1 Tax=Macrophomina phaseolina (strain MS6) TaxID=1126212 RepID=K2RHS9_MACPH|nr:Monooxygenase FAD-binding protein [Macrophomina phaseolina MS6]
MEAEIPRRYTKEEEKAVAEKYRDDPISGPAKFGDLYKNKMSSVLTALPEFVCTKWHFGRITIIGDAAHKFNPISGQGGNSAIETAAVLATNVAQMVKAQSDGGSPSDADITVAFQKTQETRRDRVANMVEAGHKQQSLSALETPIAEILGTKIAPRMGLEGSLSMFADNILPAERLPMLPMPKRPRFEPFQDELPAKPLGWQKATMAIAAVNFAILLLVAKKGMKIDSELLGWDEKASEFLGHSLRTHYTGLSSVDKMLATLSSCFGHSVFGPDPSHTAQFAYLLSLLAPVLVIWSIEGYRSANKLMPVALLVHTRALNEKPQQHPTRPPPLCLYLS